MYHQETETERERSDAIKYGDVFGVSGELADKPITPKDAATLLAAEQLILGEIPTGGVSSVMKSAAEHNESLGFVQHDDATDAITQGGAVVAETVIVGHRLIAESIGGELLGRFAQPIMDKKKGDGESYDSYPARLDK